MLKKSFTVFLFLTLSFISFAQNIRIDSLLQLIDTELDDTMTINILNELSWEYHRNDMEKSFDYATQALNESQKISYPKGEARAYNLQGIIYSLKSKEKLAIETNLKCLEIARRINSPYHIGIATNDLGISYDKINENEKAILYYQESLGIAKKIKDTLGICFTLSNIGILHLEEGNLKLSKDYFNQSVELGIHAKDSMVLSMSYANLGYTELEEKSYDDARSNFKKSKDIAEKSGDKLTFLQMILANGDADMEEKKYEIAEIQYLEAMSFIDDYGVDDESKLYTYWALVDINNKQKRFNRAIDYAEKGYRQAKDINSLYYQSSFSEQLYQNFEAINEVDKAFEHYKRFKILSDSLYNAEKAENVLALEAKYQLKEGSLENKLLKEEQLKNEAQLKQKKQINLFTLFAFLVMFLFTALLWRNYQKKKLYSLKLEKEVNQRTEALVDSNKKLVKSNQELERFAYIASHDLKEPLRNISGFSRLIGRELKESKNGKVKEYLGFVEENTFQMHNLIEDVLRYSQLKKEQLKIVNLNKVLEGIQYSMKHSIAEKNAILFIDTMPSIKSNETQLIQLFKNLIENGIKYNKSKIPRVEIKYHQKEEFHRFEVIDNGIGIAKEYQELIFKMFKRLHNRSEYKGSGLGLSIAKKIVVGLNGEINLESEEGKGSKFIIRLPLMTSNASKLETEIFEKVNV